MTDLYAAIMNLKPRHVMPGGLGDSYAIGFEDARKEAAEIVRAALSAPAAQPEPAAPTVVEPDVPETGCGNMEPVAWMWRNTKTGGRGVYFEDPARFFNADLDGDYEWTPMVAATPPRAPLTDAQIDAVTDAQWGRTAHPGHYAAYRAYARAVEAAHGIGTDREGE